MQPEPVVASAAQNSSSNLNVPQCYYPDRMQDYEVLLLSPL